MHLIFPICTILLVILTLFFIVVDIVVVDTDSNPLAMFLKIYFALVVVIYSSLVTREFVKNRAYALPFLVMAITNFLLFLAVLIFIIHFFHLQIFTKG